MIDFATRRHPLRILCVEEDVLERKLLQVCFEAARIEAIFADTASEAVGYFRKHSVDMVFIDIDRHAPGELGGFRRMRATPRRGRDVSILAVTDNACNWTDADYKQAGFGGMFLKPIEPRRLFVVIDDILQAANRTPLLEQSRVMPVVSSLIQ